MDMEQVENKCNSCGAEKTNACSVDPDCKEMECAECGDKGHEHEEDQKEAA